MALLKAVYEKLDDVPEAHRELYAEKGGKYELTGVEGIKTQGDVDRVMEGLRKERTDHDITKAKLRGFGETTPEQIETLTTENEDLKETNATLKKEGGPTEEDIDKMVERRAAARIKPLERTVEKLEKTVGERDTTIETLTTERTRGSILRTVTEAASSKEVGIVSDALPDVELWAGHVFEVDDSGNVVSRDVAGVTPGLKPADVFRDMKDSGTRRHWFGATSGAGATGSGDGKTDAGDNPFVIDEGTKKVKNFTAAAKLCKDDPEKAKRFCKAAKAERFFPSLFR